MQIKYITQEEYKPNIKPNEMLTFSSKSPIPSISLPENKIICFAIHGNYTVYGAQGTIYACRIDYNDVPFLVNIDEYSFNSDPGETEIIPIKGPLRPEYHWVDQLPKILRNQAPK